jgi:hypothetical protein
MSGLDPFARHGLRLLSPSSLALYRAAPALWCLRYLFGVRDDETAYLWRGRAVETGINAIVFDDAADDVAIEAARHNFELSAQGEISPEIDKNRRAIPEMIRRSGALFRQLGKPVAIQQKVDLWLDGIEIPVIGYCDYVYEKFIVDLKTTFAFPSRPRFNDAMQAVFYADVLSRRPGLIYVTPRKTAVYPHSEIDVRAVADFFVSQRMLCGLC